MIIDVKGWSHFLEGFYKYTKSFAFLLGFHLFTKKATYLCR